MRDSTIIREMQEMGRDINLHAEELMAQRERLLGTDARLRVHEDILFNGRGKLFWLAVRNLFNPNSVRLEVLSRFKAYSTVKMDKPADKISVEPGKKI